MNPVIGITMAALFHMLKADTRRFQIDQGMALAEQYEGRRRLTSETLARRRNLGRMRSTTSAQLQTSLAGQGVNPVLLMGAGPGDPTMAAHIARAPGMRRRGF